MDLAFVDLRRTTRPHLVDTVVMLTTKLLYNLHIEVHAEIYC